MFIRGPNVNDLGEGVPLHWVKQAAWIAIWTGSCVFAVLLLATVVIGRFSAPDSVTRKIHPGLTRDEVVAIAGRPITTQVNRDGEQIWSYWRSKCGLLAPLVPLWVQFDNEGKIIRTWI